MVYVLFFNGIQHLLLLLNLEYMGELPLKSRHMPVRGDYIFL